MYTRLPKERGEKPATIKATPLRLMLVARKWTQFTKDDIEVFRCYSCGREGEGFWIDGFETQDSNNCHIFYCLLCATDYGPEGFGSKARVCKCQNKETK